MQPGSPTRVDGLDALRGAAMVWMAVFHFCFDLNLYGLIEPRQRFTVDPFWTWQRTAIVSTFLFCAGFGQALAAAAALPARRFWRRWAQVAACALAVSIASWWMFPRSYIHFGVLHGMAVMLVIARFSAGWGAWLWPAGALAVALPLWVQHPVFDQRWLDWTGLVTRKPRTEDYVPLLPWMGVMWWGLAAGQAWLRRRAAAGASPPGDPPARGALAALATLGRWPLTFYMVHQPVFLGGIMLYMAVRKA